MRGEAAYGSLESLVKEGLHDADPVCCPSLCRAGKKKKNFYEDGPDSEDD
jgi:hypothetical protein